MTASVSRRRLAGSLKCRGKIIIRNTSPEKVGAGVVTDAEKLH